MSKYVIRGKNSGYTFTSTEIETYGQEASYETYAEAEIALNNIKTTLPYEEFEIIPINSKDEELKGNSTSQ